MHYNVLDPFYRFKYQIIIVSNQIYSIFPPKKYTSCFSIKFFILSRDAEGTTGLTISVRDAEGTQPFQDTKYTPTSAVVSR